MGHSDTLISHDGRTDFLQELLYHGYLEDTHAEIARQFIAQGEDGLSSEQRLILEEYIFRGSSKTRSVCDVNANRNGKICTK